jgi:hypothetical protein
MLAHMWNRRRRVSVTLPNADGRREIPMRVFAFILAIIAGLGLFLSIAEMSDRQVSLSAPAAVEIVEARIAAPSDNWRYGYGNYDAPIASPKRARQ